MRKIPTVAALLGVALAAPGARNPDPAHAAPLASQGVFAAPRPSVLSARLLAKLDPRLLVVLQSGDESPVPVWVDFTDKGERAPGDLAARLARAQASLTERALRRRLRARVSPLVDYRDLPVHPPYVEALRALGLSPYGASRWFNRAAVRAPASAWESMAGLDFVQRLSPVERVRLSRDPVGAPAPGEAASAPVRSTSANPADYGVSWAQLDQVQLPALHDSGYIGTGVLVCMLDDGFNWYRKHEALRTISVPPGHARDFIEGDDDVQDTVTAGGAYATHGAWTLGCLGGNKQGAYRGAAYGATFALGRTEYDPTETPVEMVYWGQGAEWADSLGADIISSSLGYSRFDDPYPDYTYADMNGRTTTVTLAAIVAAQKGILVVTAAGNEGAGTWRYVVAPGDVNGDSALTAGAVDAAGTIAYFSSRGPTSDGRIKPDVVARGVAAYVPHVAVGANSYTTVDGTSFATPIVAGVAACLLQAHPTWTPVELSQAIRFSADRAAVPDNDYGYGLARALAAAGYPVDAGPARPVAGRLRLKGPNPFVPGAGGTAFGFAIGGGRASDPAATLAIYDAGGRRVRTLWRGTSWAGLPVVWDGVGDDGRVVRSGVYWALLSSRGISSSLRVVALR